MHCIGVADYFVGVGVKETEACFALFHFLAESLDDQERGASVKVREDSVLDGERDRHGRVDADDEIPASGGEEVSVKTKSVQPFEHDVFNLRLLTCLLEESLELVLEEVLEAVESEALMAIFSFLGCALVLYQVSLPLFFGHRSTDAVTEALKLLKAEYLGHEHVMFVENILKRDLK